MRKASYALDVDIFSRQSIAVISPHLDDAVLSCGALLAACAEAGTNASVITVFNGQPELPLSSGAEEFHKKCGLGADAVKCREKEDDLAMQTVGAVSVRLGIPEALYRRDQFGNHRYPHDKDISAGSVDAEAAVVANVAERLRDEAKIQDADLVLAPLGLGSHIDHLIAGTALRMLDRKPETVLWYEDVPYILYPFWLRRSAKRNTVGPQVCRFRATHWQTKLHAIDCYASQRSILWWNQTGLAKKLTAHAKKLGAGAPAERYWSLSR